MPASANARCARLRVSGFLGKSRMFFAEVFRGIAGCFAKAAEFPPRPFPKAAVLHMFRTRPEECRMKHQVLLSNAP